MQVGAFTYSTATYQRANFWGIVQTQPNYRVLLGGIQTYSEFTYVDHPAMFSRDVSALSHTRPSLGWWSGLRGC
jgi:hypothetical protein